MKLQAPFERLRSHVSNPDLALRKAIILQAILDATSDNVSSRAKAAKYEAQAWIFSNDEYFQTICLEADLSPIYIIYATKEIIKRKNSQNDKSAKSSKAMKCKKLML